MDSYLIDVMVEVEMALASEDVAVLLETAVRATLTHEEQQPPLELSVLLTDDAQIQQMNRDFRGVDKPTDVLSFPAGEALPGMEDADPYLGDIAISVPYAARQAAQAGHDLAGELQLLVIHGVLHLLGYDHDDPEEKAAMWAAQTAVLTPLHLQHVTPTEV
ncbi:MAG: rRNA maturation RNase YbeY [Candidatus Promineifilaceae bacterium]